MLVELKKEIYLCGNYEAKSFRSYSFFCPYCNDIWARIVLEPYLPDIIHRRCQEHGNGSLLHLLEDYEAFLPKTLLQREVKLWATLLARTPDYAPQISFFHWLSYEGWSNARTHDTREKRASRSSG